MQEEIIFNLTGQKKLNDEFEYQSILPKVNKADMVGMIEANEEYIRSCHGMEKAPLAYIIRKTVVVQTYGPYPWYATPHDNMITKMLQLPKKQNRLCSELDANNYTGQKMVCGIDNKTDNDILNHICKDTDLYHHFKQKPRQDGRGAFYAIHARWLVPNNVNATASEVAVMLQTLNYDGKKNAWI